jgi:hypothetical protein
LAVVSEHLCPDNTCRQAGYRICQVPCHAVHVCCRFTHLQRSGDAPADPALLRRMSALMSSLPALDDPAFHEQLSRVGLWQSPLLPSVKLRCPLMHMSRCLLAFSILQHRLSHVNRTSHWAVDGAQKSEGAQAAGCCVCLLHESSYFPMPHITPAAESGHGVWRLLNNHLRRSTTMAC